MMWVLGDVEGKRKFEEIEKGIRLKVEKVEENKKEETKNGEVENVMG
jgi:hypothetical protein